MTNTEATELPAPTAPPTVTPIEKRRPTCPDARFGRPHAWATGAFYWPLGSKPTTLYVGDDYVMCSGCGQIEEDFDDVVDFPYECPDCGEGHEGDVSGTERCPDCETPRATER